MKKIYLIIITVIFLTMPVKKCLAETSVISTPIKNSTNFDERIAKLSNFFEKYNSVLAPFSEQMVKTADKYSIDYRLLPAISGMESTFAKFYIRNTYNAYGWGGGLIVFKSWEDSFDKVLYSLRNKYINKGANSVEKISSIYCPPNSTNWTRGVIQFMEKIENTPTITSVNDLTILL